ncbi:MAG: tRNA preQ1(34) S-adenosylmethionine ribosyltransferase-isomerase QueA [Acidimicrobiia bacterium]|nr:MAG: tRNA preQ1(34) S-adenosylmethionine ribosyltransferase-isomerase QueA [Acidimicrobiia bacterium]
MYTAEFDYDLPAAAIAQSAIEPRDASRLLVVNGLEDRVFTDLPNMLQPGDLVVVNRTRVRSARLMGRRLPGGGKTEVLLTQRVDPQRWRALVRPAHRLKEGSEVECGDILVTLLTEPDQGVSTVTISAPGDVESAIEEAGDIPLPPYFKGTLGDSNRYQTIFAQTLGSSAAPTAGLHFTDEVVDALRERNVEMAEVELEVGLDTFRPMAEGKVKDHRIHTERIHVPPSAVEAVASARDRGGNVIAVGTTVVRSLETAAAGDGLISTFDGPTDLFILPGYRPRVIDGLITNFHAPRTTLLVLVAAFMGERWKAIYAYALEHDYRFLSFGDAMYIEITR